MARSLPLMPFPSPNRFLNNPCREFNEQLVQEENKKDVTDEEKLMQNWCLILRGYSHKYSIPLY